MEIVSLIRVLRRRRALVGLGLILAVAVAAIAGGVVSSGGEAASQGSHATVHVLIDTRVPLIATSGGTGEDTIVPRAVFLADRMHGASAMRQIAQTVGIPRNSLSVVAPALPPLEEFNLVPDGQLPTVVAKATQLPRAPYVVALTPNYDVPVIAIDTAAPTPNGAVTLARAAIAAMERATQPTGHTSGAAGGTATSSSRATRPALRVVPLGAPTSMPPVPVGTHLRRGVLAAVVVFAFWCIGIVIASGISRLWRPTASPPVRVASTDL